MRYLTPLLLLLLALLPASAGERSRPDLARYFRGYDAAFVLLDVRRGTYLRYRPERCRVRLSPCSTFKIPNSMIGLETGVIPDLDHRMRWDGVKRPIEAWNQDHTLRTAYQNSVVWYYQRLASQVGPERMREWVHRLRYGNEDTSGGITQFWLENTLEISAEEQVQFLRRLLERKLPLSSRTMDRTWELMKLSETERGVLRGKTGTGGDAEKQIATLGWFVGIVTHGDENYVFAANLRGGENPSGRTARGICEAILKDRGLL